MMRVIYTGSYGEKLNFVCDSVKITNATFRKSLWEPVTSKLKYGERVLGFCKPPTTFKIDVVFFNREVFDILDEVDRFNDVFEKDLINNKLGTLEVDGWFIDCFVTETEPLTVDGGIGRRFTIYAPSPFWVQKIIYNFEKEESNTDESGSKMYNYEYDYKYSNDSSIKTFENFHFIHCDFKIIAYGPFSEFFIDINGHIYQVSVSLDNSEYLEIDSKKKIIVKTDRMGNKINCYNLQNYNSNVFQKIPTGVNTLGYNNQFGLEITLYQERSEPKYI